MEMLKGEDFIWELAHKENLNPLASGTKFPPIALELFYLILSNQYVALVNMD